MSLVMAQNLRDVSDERGHQPRLDLEQSMEAQRASEVRAKRSLDAVEALIARYLHAAGGDGRRLLLEWIQATVVYERAAQAARKR
jgi:hypothetical protein